MASTRQLFERHSLRCTRQRLQVFDSLCSCLTHPTAEELYHLVRTTPELKPPELKPDGRPDAAATSGGAVNGIDPARTDARISLATVYNTLEALVRVGLVRKIPTSSGTCRYDSDTSLHMHLRFRETSEILDLPPELESGSELVERLPADLIKKVEERYDVRVYGVSIQLLVTRRADDCKGRRTRRSSSNGAANDRPANDA